MMSRRRRVQERERGGIAIVVVDLMAEVADSHPPCPNVKDDDNNDDDNDDEDDTTRRARF